MDCYENSLALIRSEEANDVTKLISPIKLSHTDFCKRYNIDVEHDRRNAFFWNLSYQMKIKIDDELLDWCGYTGKYKNKKQNFTSLVKKNPEIKYYKISDKINPQKKYIIMNTVDFESLLMQMRSRKAKEIKKIFMLIKHLTIQYEKYEKYWAQYQNLVLTQTNNQLKSSAEEERQKFSTITRRIRQEVVEHLRNVVAPLVAPAPISAAKQHRLVLIELIQGREWYLIRRQKQSIQKAIKQVLKKNPGSRVSHRWIEVPHSVDVGNTLKKQLRNVKWFARGNILRVDENQESSSNEEIIAKIDQILSDNVAIDLSLETLNIIQ